MGGFIARLSPDREGAGAGIGSHPAAGRVLLVDDEPVNLELASEFLRGLDCEVLRASNGRTALELAVTGKPDVILLDVMMPGMSGFDACAALKADPRTAAIPVVMVTALNSVEDRVAALEAGAHDFLAKPLESVELRARVRSLLQLAAANRKLHRTQSVVEALARAVEAKDSGTEAHTARVAASAVALGRLAGLAGEDLEDLRLGAVVHDIGKIGVPDRILAKPGPLDEEEWVVMRRHVLWGEEIAAPLGGSGRLGEVIRHHHERFDGGGYPDRLAGSRIPLMARIVAICDAFDAMTQDRPYRPALTLEEAHRRLRTGAGSQWDAELVRLFIGISEPGPI